MLLLFAVLASTCLAYGPPSNNYLSLFNPQNYLPNLPNLNLPYVSSIPIPSIKLPPIKPTPVSTTKLITVVTATVHRHHFCVKRTEGKPPCNLIKKDTGLEYLVTKEYTVQDHIQETTTTTATPTKPPKTPNRIKTKKKKRKKQKNKKKNPKSRLLDLETSEFNEPFDSFEDTPHLRNSNSNQMQEFLIEDRLDHLEKILPHYTRKKAFVTSTVTVTKTKIYDGPTATLLAYNCVPQGVQICPSAVKDRKKTSTVRYTKVPALLHG